MPKKFEYYHVDCGHFPAQIKLCFSDETFQKILRDHGITMKASALDEGVAETHYLTDGKTGVIVIAFDLEECLDGDESYLAGVIAHEATHCVCRVFEHIGEPPEEIGEESRAYLTEHIVRQLTAGVRMEMEKRARKTSGKLPEQKGKGDGRDEPKVDKHGDGGAGQGGAPKKSDSPDRAKNKGGKAVGKTKDSVQKT